MNASNSNPDFNETDGPRVKINLGKLLPEAGYILNSIPEIVAMLDGPFKLTMAGKEMGDVIDVDFDDATTTFDMIGWVLPNKKLRKLMDTVNKTEGLSISVTPQLIASTLPNVTVVAGILDFNIV